MTSSLYQFDCVADRIKQARQVSKAPVVIVEGKSDKRLLERSAHFAQADVFVAHTRSRALEAARQCQALGMAHLACAVDRDFDDEVSAAEVQRLPVAPYDGADLEGMLWSSVALDQLLEEVASDQKLHNFGGVAALRLKTEEILRPISRLRRASLVHRWGLNFDDLDLISKISLRTLELSISGVCQSLWHADLPAKLADLFTAADNESVPSCPYTGVELIRGRDALAVAAVALRRLIGSLNHQQAQVNRLEELLRLAVTDAALTTTTWFDRVEQLLAA